jgi:hypothetical protein
MKKYYYCLLRKFSSSRIYNLQTQKYYCSETHSKEVSCERNTDRREYADCLALNLVIVSIKLLTLFLCLNITLGASI